MMAMREDPDAAHSPRVHTRSLAVLLGLIAVCFAVNDLLAARAFAGGPRALQPLAALVLNLLMVGAVWGLSKLGTSILKTGLLSLLLATIAFAGFGVTVNVVRVLAARKTFLEPWPWQTAVVFSTNLLIGLCAVLSVLPLELWKDWTRRSVDEEPVSPATRKAQKILGLSALVSGVGALALAVGTFSMDHPAAFFSNRPVPLWLAILAIACWLVGQTINKGWWYASAGEVERKADDFGNLAAWALFFIATPAWWVAARAGLLPQPNAMILWAAAVAVAASGEIWRRHG